ncbi:MAG TPA: hypothetical protein VI636_14755 [Candidatus Angelobacter sp.]
MTREPQQTANRTEYTFRGSKFWIPAEELITAVRQADQLHQELMDELMEEVERQSAFLIEETTRCDCKKSEVTPGEPDATE